MTRESIGFVGAGLMGHGIAANILKGGYPLGVIAHRSRTQVEELVGRGATEASDLADLGARSSIVFL
jgi:3-hydroxyisobutyrate dehydrogenase-like beta-hydroxyacid dehydrogenase